jgi:EPS-associated MarR family transcriptional regulator
MDSRKTDISLLKILQKDPTITQRGIAAEVGLSLGTVNYCLKKLVEKGWVKTNNFRYSNNKKSYSYLLTTKGIKEKKRLIIEFIACKEKEYQQIKREIARLKKEVS